MTTRDEADFDQARRVVVFLLGIIIVIVSLFTGSSTQLIIGVILIGVLPIERVLDVLDRRRRRNGD